MTKKNEETNIHNINLLNLIDETTNYFVVDIGASKGVSTDPCFPFITNKNFNGLCIEGDSEKIKTLKNNISSKINIFCGYLTPDNVISIFNKYNVPKNLFLIKIDIDGYDLEVIRKILSSEYKPTLFIAEINEKIPPPIKFEVKYKDNYEWDYSHCFGFSLQSGKDVFEPNDYFIVCLYDLNNILCIRKDKIYLLPNFHFPKNINQIYQKEYIENIKREETLPWNKNVDHWLTIDKSEVLKNTIETYFTKVNDRSIFDKKEKILNEDFILSL